MALCRTMSDERPVVNATAHIVNHEGQHVPIRISTAFLKDDEDRIKGGVSEIREVARKLTTTLRDPGEKSAALFYLVCKVPTQERVRPCSLTA
ncbi:hypothetical protein [Syntrophorhabdus aromaticivorans]|uniref:hypothetical protein n=1 Tax=Syntrophorhabdus aromaticivorans TaxID=328301 RepID=UPI0012EB3020|nr:hypothetical protein [Syntrophorhabdus aromaticivorans]